jgi:predicted transcriptional regulator
MERLTKSEEDIMRYIWEKERCTVSEIIYELPDPKPPHSTISSIVRILEKKGYLNHKAYGRTYEYFPIITKEVYSKKSLRKLVGDYFGGSMNQLVSFLVKEEALDKDDLERILSDFDKKRES